MQGISTSKHQHLVDALLHLEHLLSTDFKQDTEKQQAAELRQELEVLHKRYHQQLRELSDLIIDYQDLFNKTKIQFLGKKLKELRKHVPTDKPMFQLLAENIRVAYGT